MMSSTHPRGARNLFKNWAGLLTLLTAPFLTAGSCSREHVESMQYMNDGVMLAQQQQHIAAIEKLEQAASVEPTNDQAFWNLAIVHMELRRFEAARDDMQRAIAVKPDVAGYQEKLGTILMELGKAAATPEAGGPSWSAAKQAFEKAIQLDPALFKAYYKLGRVEERLAESSGTVPEENEHLGAALRRYSEAIQKGPRFLEAYRSLGRLYADLGFLEQAVQVLRGAEQVALGGTEEEAEIRHLLGTVYQEQGKAQEAIAEFRAALEIQPGLRDALFSLGWTYAEQGNREEAERFLRKFIDIGGEDAPADYVRAARDRLSELSGQ